MVPIQPSAAEFVQACQFLPNASFEVVACPDRPGFFHVMSEGQTQPYYPYQAPNQVMTVARVHGYHG